MLTDKKSSEQVQTINSTKIFHGVFKHQQLIPASEDDDVEASVTASTSGNVAIGNDEASLLSPEKKKKKSKLRDAHWLKRLKADPNAPSFTRIPLPEVSESWKNAKNVAMDDLAKRVKINSEKLPSVCLYTFLNSHQGVNCCEISEDSSLLCAGFEDSTVHVWSLNDRKIAPLRPSVELEKLDKDADDILNTILDHSNSSSHLTFVGHRGPVYNSSFDLDKRLLLSCSADATARLWSLQTWTNLVVYKVNDFPIWDVEFGPYGYYFVTGGADRCAVLWTMDKQHPVRVFYGHESDVNCVAFHPNANYIATGSDDNHVRLWDALSGECVRHFADSTSPIQTVQTSFDGKFLAAGTYDGTVLLWDIGKGCLVANWPKVHDDLPVYALAFNRDSDILATGGHDSKVSVLNLNTLKSASTSETSVLQSQLPSFEASRLAEFFTKSSPVVHLHFTRRNLLMGVGRFDGE